MWQTILVGIVISLFAGGVLLAVQLGNQRWANRKKLKQYQDWQVFFRGVTADRDSEGDPEEIADFFAYLDDKQNEWDGAYVEATENGAAEVVHQHVTRFLLDHQLRYLTEISYLNKVIAARVMLLHDLLGEIVADENRPAREQAESSDTKGAAGIVREDVV